MEIMTGYTGKPHVSAEQFRSFLVSLFGDGSYIFPIKDQLEYVLESSNLLTVKSGMMIHHGNISHVEKEIGE